MYRLSICLVTFVSLAIGGGALLASQQGREMSYKERREMFLKLDPEVRKIPKIPPKGERIRVIIDSDAKNEIDDICTSIVTGHLIINVPPKAFLMWVTLHH